jgi:hypothetical protein
MRIAFRAAKNQVDLGVFLAGDQLHGDLARGVLGAGDLRAQNDVAHGPGRASRAGEPGRDEPGRRPEEQVGPGEARADGPDEFPGLPGFFEPQHGVADRRGVLRGRLALVGGESLGEGVEQGLVLPGQLVAADRPGRDEVTAQRLADIDKRDQVEAVLPAGVLGVHLVQDRQIGAGRAGEFPLHRVPLQEPLPPLTGRARNLQLAIQPSNGGGQLSPGLFQRRLGRWGKLGLGRLARLDELLDGRLWCRSRLRGASIMNVTHYKKTTYGAAARQRGRPTQEHTGIPPNTREMDSRH